MKQKILILGATGNVGSYVWKYALDFFDKNKYEIIAVGRRRTDFFAKHQKDLRLAQVFFCFSLCFKKINGYESGKML